MNLLTISSANTWHDCHRRYFYMYEQGWRPVRIKESLRVGTMIHSALEAWWKWNDITEGIPVTRLEAAFAAIAEKADSEIDRIKAEEIMLGYDRQWGRDRDHVSVLGVEVKFRAPLLHPETLEWAEGWELGGKVDVLQYENSGTDVVEHKTTSSAILSDADPYWAKLPLDPQLSCYVIGAETLGHQASECIYDVIRKPESRFRTATPADKRKYTKDGKLYANQREKDETPEEFRLRLREEIAENPDAFYRRKRVPRMHGELKNFLADAWDTAHEIDDARANDRWPRNPDACFRYGGMNRCAFYDVCANGLDLETSGEFERKEIHPELTEGDEDVCEPVTE